MILDLQSANLADLQATVDVLEAMLRLASGETTGTDLIALALCRLKIVGQRNFSAAAFAGALAHLLGAILKQVLLVAFLAADTACASVPVVPIVAFFSADLALAAFPVMPLVAQLPAFLAFTPVPFVKQKASHTEFLLD